MKGRRKLKTEKWHLIARLILDSRAILDSKSHALQKGKFLSNAIAASSVAEPVGMLAGKQRRRE